MSQLSNKDKFKALAKQAAISAAMNVVPGPVSFMLEMGTKVYELWGSASLPSNIYKSKEWIARLDKIDN